jgi:tellurite resistance protein TerC
VTPFAVAAGPGLIAAVALLIIGLLLVDLLVFARGREPTFKEGVAWSIGWLVLGLAVTVPMLVLDGSESGVNYLTVYLIERSLSLDNLFVFLLLFAYFSVDTKDRARLLALGIAGALALRGLAILGGVELIERFHIVIYILGVLLLFLAYRMYRGVNEDVDPEKGLVVKTVRRVIPNASPAALALASIIAADIAFAVDSIPAAFAVTTDSFVIWVANAFALLGLRALFVLVEGLIKRFRYLNETVAVVLAIVAVKLLIEDFVKISPAVSLLLVFVAFAIGVIASVLVDRKDPDSERKQQERTEALERSHSGSDSD